MRPATEADGDLLIATYASTREPELGALPDEARAAFVATQWQLKSTAYRAAYGDHDFEVIEVVDDPVGGEAVGVGYMFLARLADGSLRIVDIALLPPYRGRGVGSAVLADVLARADAARAPVFLRVEASNPARRFYERLGFVEMSTNDLDVTMSRQPKST